MRLDGSAASFESPGARSHRSLLSAKQSMRWEQSLRDLQEHEDELWGEVEFLKAQYGGLRKEVCRAVEQLRGQSKRKIDGIVRTIEDTLKMMDSKVSCVVDSCDTYVVRTTLLVRGLEERSRREELERLEIMETINLLASRFGSLQQRYEQSVMQEQECSKQLYALQQSNTRLSQELVSDKERYQIAILANHNEIAIRNQLIAHLQERCDSLAMKSQQVRDPFPTPETEADNHARDLVGGAPYNGRLENDISHYQEPMCVSPRLNSSPQVQTIAFVEPLLSQRTKSIIETPANSFEIRPQFFKQQMCQTRKEERVLPGTKGISVRTLSSRDDQKPADSRLKPERQCAPKGQIRPVTNTRLADLVTAETETCVFEDYRESAMEVSSNGTYLFHPKE